MKSLYQKYNEVVLVDSTYKTSKYKMPVLVFAAINNLNRTFLLGFEGRRNLFWVFNQLFGYLGAKQTTIVSDSCGTLKKNIPEVLEETTHLLCGWHVSQITKSHLSGLNKIFRSFN